MDEKPEQILNHIESQRDQLGRNLNELESRVKRTTDWRAQFDRNPMLVLGAAMGGGLLLGAMMGGSSGRKSKSGSASWSYGKGYSGSSSSAPTTPSSSYGVSAAYSSPAVSEQRKKATDTLEHIKAALIGFATAKAKEFMAEALPGFNQHLEEAATKHSSGQDHASTASSHQPSGYEGVPSQPSTGSQSGSGYQAGQSAYKQDPVGSTTGSNI